MQQTKTKKKLSVISALHYFKLFFRGALFLVFFIGYVFFRKAPISWSDYVITTIIWIVFMIDMILRFFPSRFDSMGSQKQFRCNYIPKKNPAPMKRLPSRSTFIIVVFWCALNGVLGILRLLNILDDEGMLLICLFYSVCDMICILFFCPFQTWIMKNRCCVGCRIYNWDFAMMFTPLLFIPHIYTWTLLGASLVLLIRWEISYHRHPEYFCIETNDSLSCANCKEKLCEHKKQLRYFWEKEKANLEKRFKIR